MTDTFDAVLAEGRNVIRDQCGDGLERRAFLAIADRLAAGVAEIARLSEKRRLALIAMTEDRTLQRTRAEAAERDARAKQARIDELMLEYCPDEMPPEQVAEWKRHQAIATTEQAPERAGRE